MLRTRLAYRLRRCFGCGRRHWNARWVSLPMCRACFEDWIGGR